MYGTAAATARTPRIRYGDHGALNWIWQQAPCTWYGKVDLEFIAVPMRLLEPAGSWTDPAIVSEWLMAMKTGRTVPPPIVCSTDRGTLYVYDGNHRYEAMRELFGGNPEAQVRVARVAPRSGYHFSFSWFGNYGTYVLKRVPAKVTDHRRLARRARPKAPLGQTMVLVAHPDDETGGCGGLLQRLWDPLVVFATDGTPQDQFFWLQYGSRRNYSRVRRQEAAAALAVAGIRRLEFLDGDSGSQRFCDQYLYRAIPHLFKAISELIRRHSPEAMLVPAYEGGHPDHDVLSFIGWLVRRCLRLPVWEMPLYHRSDSGMLVRQRFREVDGTERCLPLSSVEVRTRTAMIACYRSQRDLAHFVVTPVECVRPQHDYDYSRPPHSGRLNYQMWDWPISPGDLCRGFQESIALLGVAGGRASTCRGAATGASCQAANALDRSQRCATERQSIILY